jgi:4-hydroxybenzoyl-CoA reductase subunit alpha
MSNHEQPTSKSFNIIGTPVPLLDSGPKVTGEAKFTDDFQFTNTLVGKILRSPLPHARIKSISVAKALALPGVFAIVTGKDAPVRFGVLPISEDENAMAVDKVRYVGDPVAGVAAVDEATALRALQLIDVEYENLPVYLDPAASLTPAQEKIHEKSVRDTNIHKEVSQHFGNIEKARETAVASVSASFHFPGVTHAFTEPHAVVALFSDDGHLTVYSATQVTHYVHRALAKVLDMDMHRIRVIKPYLGGGFGGKGDPFAHEIIASLLARRTGRPVKITFDREEVFLTHHGRHPTTISLTAYADQDHHLTGLDLQTLIDGGAYAGFGVVTTYYNGVLTQGPYRVPNFRYQGTRVYTNKMPCGPMRGHGAVNSRYAFEVAIDMLAERLQVDPCVFRRDNFLPPSTETANQFRITSNGIATCLQEVMTRSHWQECYGKLLCGEGIGVGCGFYISGSALPIHRSDIPQSTVVVKVDADGKVVCFSGVTDIGQGANTMIAQCVAEILGLPLHWLRVHAGDTELAPIDFGSYSSRETFMGGNAACQAALQIREELTKAARELAGHPAGSFVFHDAKVTLQGLPAREFSFMDVVQRAIAHKGALVAKGSYESPQLGGSFKGAGAGLSPAYSFGACIARVSVDRETGFIRVRKVWLAHDCGKALNPLAVEGQIEGSVHMGLGQLLCENFHYQGATLTNANLLEYKTILPVDMPEVEAIIVESGDPEGPFGAKECGEGALHPVLPAVGNAIYNAIGVRFFALPITPDQVLSAMAKDKRG